MTTKLYISTVETECLNMTLGLFINPGDVVEIDYTNQEIKNQTTGQMSKLPNIEQAFKGLKNRETGKYENTLRERMESGLDGNWKPYKEPGKKAGRPRKGGD